MSAAIRDEFTDLPVSGARRKQLRWKRDGHCVKCGLTAVTAQFCLYHAIWQREYQRRRKGTVRRTNSKTRRMEAVANV